MRVRLKGINSITKKLADGTRRTYWYAWKGGPPLRGEPGTPEFVHSYNEAIARRVVPPQGTMLSPLRAYQASGGARRAHARRLHQAHHGNRERLRRIPASGADRPAHSRHLHGVARSS